MSKTHKTDRCHDLLCTCGQAVSWSVVLEQLYIIVSLLRACLKEMFYPCLVIVSKNFQENCIGETVFFLLFLGDVLSESQPRNTVKPTNVCYLGGVLLCCWLYHISLSLQSCLLNKVISCWGHSSPTAYLCFMMTKLEAPCPFAFLTIKC